MKTYSLEWKIELEAETPEDAARMARDIIKEGSGGVWNVRPFGADSTQEVLVDLDDETTDDIPWNEADA